MRQRLSEEDGAAEVAAVAPEAAGKELEEWVEGERVEEEAGEKAEAGRVAGAATEVEPEEGIRNRWDPRYRNWGRKCRSGTCKCAISCCCS